MIELRDVSKVYHIGGGLLYALKEVSLTIDSGEMIAIVGPSGSGKSSLMNIIGMLDRPTTGAYYYNDKAIAAHDDDELAAIRNRMIGFVFQSFCLLPRLSAWKNVAMPLLYRHEHGAKVKQKALAVLDKVGMRQYAEHKPLQLSGGQQQRVAIARALIGEPQVVLADEPTGALDQTTGREVMDLFKRLNQEEGATIVVITHDEKISQQCSRIIHIEDGSIV